MHRSERPIEIATPASEEESDTSVLVSYFSQFVKDDFGNLGGELPGLAARSQVGQFAQILDLSHCDGTGMAYRLPEHVHAEKDAPL